MQLKECNLTLVLIAGAIGIGFISACNNGEPASTDRQTARGKTAVEVMNPRVTDLEKRVSYRGRVEGENDGLLSFRVGGTLSDIFVEEGQLVEKGALLARLEVDELQERMKRASSEVSKAEDQFNFWIREYRIDSILVKQGAVSETRYHQSLLNYQSARSSLNAARHALAETRIMVEYASLKAPYTGYIGTIQMNPGVNIGPNEPVMFLHAGAPRIELNVLEQDVRNGLKAGSPVYIDECDGTGNVQRIDAQARPPFESVRIYVTLPSSCLAGRRPGSYMTVELVQQTFQNAFLVPESAIDLRGARPRVFRVNDRDIVEAISVDLGIQQGNWRQVKSPLSAKDRIIYTGTVTVSPGTPVKVIEKDTEAGKGADQL